MSTTTNPTNQIITRDTPKNYYVEIPTELIPYIQKGDKASLTIGSKNNKLVFIYRFKTRDKGYITQAKRIKKREKVIPFRLPRYIGDSMELDGKKLEWSRHGPEPDKEINDVENLVRIKGVGVSKVDSLIDAGYDSLEKVRKASLSELKQVDSIGQAVAKRLKRGADPIIVAEPIEE